MIKGKTPLMVAIALGLLAALLAYYTLRHKETILTKRWGQSVKVVVAARDIDAGTTLDIEMLSTLDEPAYFVTSSVLQPGQVDRVLGQRVMVDIQRGDRILWNQFYAEGSHERMSKMLDKQGRAMSLSISGTNAVAGHIQPADRVDILGTFTDPKTNQRISVTMMQDVVVLATGSKVASGLPDLPGQAKGDYQSITVWVIPEEAEILALAEEMGTLRLTLRPEDDIGRMEKRGLTYFDTIINGDRLIKVAKIRQRITVVRLGQKR